MRVRIPLLIMLVVFVTTVAAAQEWWRRGFGGYRRVPPRFAKAGSFDGRFNFCRLMYTSVRREAGGQGWSTDYPDADINFSIRLSELTKTARQPRAHRRSQSSRRAHHGRGVVPVSVPADGRCG